MANQSPSSDSGLGEAVDRDGGGLGLRRRLDMKVSGSGFRDAGRGKGRPSGLRGCGARSRRAGLQAGESLLSSYRLREAARTRADAWSCFATRN